MARVLVGDVGATNVRLAAFENRVLVAKHVAPARSFEVMLKSFLKQHGPFRAAVFGAAGPVVHGKVRLTNARLTLDETALGRLLKCKVRLLNDVEAAAYGLARLTPRDVVPLARASESANSVLIIPGTGLGEAIIHDGHVFASEGGHADFAPRTAVEWDLKRFLHDTKEDTSVEAILSGRGLLALYDFLKHEQFAQQDERVRDAIREQGPRAITEAALRHDPLSVGAVELFVDVLAGEAQRLALTARGGVYLAGNIVRHVLPELKRRFLRRFLNSPMRLEHMPVFVVLDEDLTLHGAEIIAREFSAYAQR
ncbi:MAG TPA: ROK family protein [Candidatus Binatia bacterium]|nr:ROK family protein [Candidatus Binatia bacterium]